MEADVGGVSLVLRWTGKLCTNDSVLRTAAKQLADLLNHNAEQGVSMVLVHGAGDEATDVTSGGQLEDRGTPEAARRIAAARSSLTRLHHRVVAALLEQGVHAMGLSPGSAWVTSGGAVASDSCPVVRHALEAGLLPVLHADVVFDRRLRSWFLGEDQIVGRLCEAFHPPLAVLLTTTDGFEEPGAQRIARIAVAPSSLSAVTADGRAATAVAPVAGDVKLEQALAIARTGAEVRVAGMGRPAALEACTDCMLPDWCGTVLKAG